MATMNSKRFQELRELMQDAFDALKDEQLTLNNDDIPGAFDADGNFHATSDEELQAVSDVLTLATLLVENVYLTLPGHELPESTV